MNNIKIIFLGVMIFLLLSISYSKGMDVNTDSTTCKLPISIKFGYKAPTDFFYSSTTSGICFNISTEFDAGKNFLIQPAFLLWSSKYKFIDAYHENITLTTFASFLGYNIYLEKLSIVPKVGLGLSKASDTSKRLLSALYGVEFNYDYESSIKLQAEVVNHYSAGMDVGGGGSSFNSFLFLLGIQFSL